MPRFYLIIVFPFAISFSIHISIFYYISILYRLPRFRLYVVPPNNCQGNFPTTNTHFVFTFKRNHLPLGPCHLLYYSNKKECILFGEFFGKGTNQSILSHFDSLTLGARTLRQRKHWKGRGALTKRSFLHNTYLTHRRAPNESLAHETMRNG